MIISLSFKNFYSFADEVTIDFENPKAHPKSELYAVEGKHHLSKALMLVGANASGKSNVLKAFSFVTNFMMRSFSEPVNDAIKLKPHFSKESEFFWPSSIGVPNRGFSNVDENITTFELKFFLASKEYRYVLHLTDKRVYHEALYIKLSQKPTCFFKRDFDIEKNEYNYQDTGFGFQKELGEKTRENVSIISMAHQHSVPLASQLVTFLSGCVSNIHWWGIHRRDTFDVSAMLAKNKKLFNAVKENLIKFDLGLEDIEIKIVEGSPVMSHASFAIHKIGNLRKELVFSEESRGTKRLYALLIDIMSVLNSGGLAIIDELDSELHIDMLDHILRLFFNKETNPHNAQIIFTSHILEPMNILDKQQIILVEKDKKTLSSEAWKISDIQGLHPEENIYKKYKASAYGAVPQFD